MATEGYQNTLSKALQSTPASKSVNLDKSVLTIPTEKDALDVILKSTENNIGVRALENPEIETALFQNLQAMLGGKLTPQQAMEKVQEVSAKTKRN
jgi:ABC-type glycerol-3-phosphate transport system substrate-binding protein